jgi:hypothetical protein
MTVNEMIQKFNITITVQNGEEGLNARFSKKPSQAQIAELKAKKPEVIAELKRRESEKEAAYKARQARINSIEGLEAIRKAMNAEENYHMAFNRMMEDADNDGAFAPRRPQASSQELKGQYPKAAAYLKAESYSYSSNYVQAGAGKKALERIINGEDYATVLADMEKEWSDYCTERIWD